ncbi:MAG: chemotaxis-specific protein-glutamate methyltransferase CheB [Oceanobacter sp.]
MIRLLIVDDSALMRRLLAGIFKDDGDYEIHLARNGQEAVEMNRDLEPDVITLDINMPEMDGLEALSLIMAERPVPVVMVSSLTEKGALATFEALNLGAIDFVTKPGGTISLSVDDVKEDLKKKVRIAAKARLRKVSSSARTAEAKPTRTSTAARSTATRPRPKATQSRSTATQPGSAASSAPRAGSPTGLNIGRPRQFDEPLVILGVSTGGPRTLEDILPELPGEFPAPILIAQHMPASFTKSLADRLDRACAMSVQEVAKPTTLEAGSIYIGRGGADMVPYRSGNNLMVTTKPEDPEFLWHPSVERLGLSVMRSCVPSQILAVMLTGMGYDGDNAFTELRQAGAHTIAESEETAVVFGMPDALIRKGGAKEIVPAHQIAARMQAWSRKYRRAG